MTVIDEQTLLANAELPFVQRQRVTPYREYFRALIPTVDQTPTVREVQYDEIIIIGDAAGHVVVTDFVETGFQEVYENITIRYTATGQSTRMRREFGPPVDLRQRTLAYYTPLAGQAQNILGTVYLASTSWFNTPGPLTLYSGERLRIEIVGNLAIGNNFSVQAIRYRIPSGVAVPQNLDGMLHET